VSLIDDIASTTLALEEPVLFEKGKPGRVGYSFSPLKVPVIDPKSVLPSSLCRDEVLGFPEVSENEIVRHFVRLSQKNYSIDTGFYPLGSCTMKYNPKINEEMARNKNLRALHPFWPENFLTSAFAVQVELQKLLCAVSGLDAFTLQPNAGAHGEYTGIKIIEAYHLKKGLKKTKFLIPDSAHGTNPATCAMLGYEIIPVPTGPDGIVEVKDIKPLLDSEVAGIMITNPNTLGLFEKNLMEIAELIHSVDGLVYMDGANFNALLGIVRPSDLGVDVMHINLHKTFSTPHGGGGPGSGPVGVKRFLQEFLPVPRVQDGPKGYEVIYEAKYSIGRVGPYFGNFAIHIRALTYMLSIGTTTDGKDSYLRQMSTAAVLNANYIRHRLQDFYHIPYNTICMHEVILSDEKQAEDGIKTLHIAKRLMDYGYHPMTVYFPLVVHGAMMIEPTESETKETLDQFCDVMIEIAKECKKTPEVVQNAPTRVPRQKVDELRAQKQPRLRWSPLTHSF